MTRWRYVEPGPVHGQPIVHELSESEILVEYYSWWIGQMHRVGKADQISERACIEDWVIVHWAEKVE